MARAAQEVQLAAERQHVAQLTAQSQEAAAQAKVCGLGAPCCIKLNWASDVSASRVDAVLRSAFLCVTCCAFLRCAVLYCAVLRRDALSCAVLCWAVLQYAVSCAGLACCLPAKVDKTTVHAMLCCAMLCCAAKIAPRVALLLRFLASPYRLWCVIEPYGHVQGVRVAVRAGY